MVQERSTVLLSSPPSHQIMPPANPFPAFCATLQICIPWYLRRVTTRFSGSYPKNLRNAVHLEDESWPSTLILPAGSSASEATQLANSRAVKELPSNHCINRPLTDEIGFLRAFSCVSRLAAKTAEASGACPHTPPGLRVFFSWWR